MKTYEIEMCVVVGVEDENDLLYTQEAIMQNLMHMYQVQDTGIMCSYEIEGNKNDN